MKKILICGYFSLPYKTNTAGDLLVLDSLTKILTKMGYDFDIISDNSIELINNSVILEDVVPSDYFMLIFVCGPLVNTKTFRDFINNFQNMKKIAINVSVISEHQSVLDCFDHVIPRDSELETNIDLAIGSPKITHTPVVGLIFVGQQKEYTNQLHDKVTETVNEVLSEIEIAKVYIDTKLPFNEYGLKNSAEIETLISKMDFIITTRLHGCVLALKNKVPFIAIDPVSNGAKILKQTQKMKWPLCVCVNNLEKNTLKQYIFDIINGNYNEQVVETLEYSKNLFEDFSCDLQNRLEVFLND